MLRSHNDTAVIIAENTAYYYICSLTDKERNELTFDISFINDYSYNSHFIENISKEQSKALVLVFTNLMNRKATSLGCNSTHYITPNGLDASDDADIHSTTAYELAVVMSYCIKNEHFLSITQTHDYSFTSLSGRKYSVSNANAFLNMYDNIYPARRALVAMPATAMYVPIGITTGHLSLPCLPVAGLTTRLINGLMQNVFLTTPEPAIQIRTYLSALKSLI